MPVESTVTDKYLLGTFLKNGNNRLTELKHLVTVCGGKTTLRRIAALNGEASQAG